MEEAHVLEQRVLAAIAEELRHADRAELREIGEAVSSGAHSFGDIAAHPGYAEFIHECDAELAALTVEEFFADEDSPAEPEPAAPARDPHEEEDEPPESFLV
ncbi:hypothetical protein SAMN02982929_01319 [Saccharopolyspora kobensis]|uniref:Uncharacterized protein n=1 Tax=Saccharopolyspora kobensis TaxID=146035 RepID=A0A1H5WV86_9PSEU|nr:hypothetical protein [Saccharopolyspora kobensis]SEG03422.1 hypothetical protein SAMN02982929_01319 [Saccharopolyspora kobensis]SFD80104.1 hypothetical protein SAMN05216506_106295 [Saccharopolyspora kobensis]